MKQEHEQSFLSEVEEHKGIIYKVTYAYSKGPDDRKDLFQEILVSLWKAYPSFKGNSKISTWIYKVALYTAITNYRNEKTQIKFEQLDRDISLSVSDSFNPEPEERVRFLYQAIGKLASVDKAIIILLLEEKSYKEIAQILGLKPAAVGMRINRAKDKLTSFLKSIKL